MVVVAGGGSKCKRIHMGGGGLGKTIECVPGGGGAGKTIEICCWCCCLRADVSYFLCCTRKRDVCVTPSLIVFQRPAGFPRSWEHAVIG